MNRTKEKVSSNKTTASPSKKRAEREAQLKKGRTKNMMVIGVVLIAIITVSVIALLQDNGTEPEGGSSNDDGLDDNNDGDDAVYGRYGLIIDGNPTIMDIGSTSCIPCQQLQPILSALGQEYDGQINIEFYDCWNTALGAEMATKYRCSVIPTLIFLDGDGNEVARLMGYNSQSVIEAKMSELGWI